MNDRTKLIAACDLRPVQFITLTKDGRVIPVSPDADQFVQMVEEGVHDD